MALLHFCPPCIEDLFDKMQMRHNLKQVKRKAREHIFSLPPLGEGFASSMHLKNVLLTLTHRRLGRRGWGGVSFPSSACFLFFFKSESSEI